MPVARVTKALSTGMLFQHFIFWGVGGRMYISSWLSKTTRYPVRVQSCSDWAEHWNAEDHLLQVNSLQR